MLQEVPFQCSDRVLARNPGNPSPSECPTAHTSSGAMASTPVKKLLSPSTVGVDTTLQVVPSQCSARVLATPASSRKYPTAHMSVEEVAEAAASSLSPLPELGVATATHEGAHTPGVARRPPGSAPGAVAHPRSETVASTTNAR